MTRREISPGLYIDDNPPLIYSFSEMIRILDKGDKPDTIDFFSEYCTLTEVLDIADKYNYHIITSGYTNVTRLSKQPDNNSIVQVARNKQDIDRLLS